MSFLLLIMFLFLFFFFFNDTATTEIYTLSLHDALPIYLPVTLIVFFPGGQFLSSAIAVILPFSTAIEPAETARSEEHTSELQSQSNLVCRLLLEKKKKQIIRHINKQTRLHVSTHFTISS